MKRKVMIVVGVILLLLVIGYVFFPAIYEYDMNNIHKGIHFQHVLGTDYVGRDNLTMLCIASGITLLIALSSAILSVILSVIVGTISGYYGGIVDFIGMRLCEVLETLPTLPILIVIHFLLQGILPMYVFLPCSIALFSWVEGARLLRSEVLLLKKQEYVEAAKVMGASTKHILRKHMIKNCMPLLKSNFIVVLARAIVLESSISFLGFGMDAGIPTLGKLVNLARQSDIFLHYPLDYLPAALICFAFVFVLHKIVKEK